MRKTALTGRAGTGRFAAMALAAANVVEGILPKFGEPKKPEFFAAQEIQGTHKMRTGKTRKRDKKKLHVHRRNYLSGPSWWMGSK